MSKAKTVNQTPKTGDTPPQAALSELNPHSRQKALDKFGDALSMYLGKNSSIRSREAVLKLVGDAVQYTFDVRQFDNFLEALFQQGYLRVKHRTLEQLSEKLKGEHKFPRTTVVSGSSDDAFKRVAAEILIQEIERIGNLRKPRPICIGVVSGTTNEKVIACAEKLDWIKDCGVNPDNFPPINVLPVNTHPTLPKNIGANAMILGFKLASKINSTCNDTNRAKAYGLNVPVIVEKHRLPEIDQAIQNREVLEFTEPHRLDSKRPFNETSLDIILTSVGDIGKDEKSGSIFYQFAHSAIKDMDKFVEQTRLVGDLAFNPLSSMGDEVGLKDRDGNEIVFYSAASLSIFKAVADNDEKAVILVSQFKEKKIPIIFASRRYVSRMIIDEDTAKGLIHY